jgi:hypothetical protein
MPQWEYLTITITFGENETVKSVTCGDQIMFTDAKWSEVRLYIHELNSDGWQVTDRRPEEWGEVHVFKKLSES